MENSTGAVLLLAVLALFPSLKLAAELIDSIVRKLRPQPEAQKIRDHLQEQL